MIDIVAAALSHNGVRFAKCTSRHKQFGRRGPIQAFRTDPGLRLLLLPLSLGAEGLDLVVASHVFLLEPLLNPHQEAQAVNRVHRIGQTRGTFVHKYVVTGTIEQRILQFSEHLHNLHIIGNVGSMGDGDIREDKREGSTEEEAQSTPSRHTQRHAVEDRSPCLIHAESSEPSTLGGGVAYATPSRSTATGGADSATVVRTGSNKPAAEPVHVHTPLSRGGAIGLGGLDGVGLGHLKRDGAVLGAGDILYLLGAS